jgi:hypothetical protein
LSTPLDAAPAAPSYRAHENAWALRLGEALGPRFEHRAACAGRWPLFDADVDGEDHHARERRLQRAVAVCQSCPALEACRDLLDGLPAGTRGVWGGVVLTSSPKANRAQLAALRDQKLTNQESA